MGGHHGHDHHHGHFHSGMGQKLGWSLAATVIFVIVEVLAGVQAGSLALLSDAGHNVTDAMALLLAVFGFYIQKRPADEVKTYGYHRAGVLAAFVNALVLMVLSAYIYWESFERLRAPQPVSETTMFVVAGLGLLVNVAIMFALHAGSKDDLNVRAAFLHMLGDALGSVGIIIGAFIIKRTGWFWIDPILSIIIASLIVWSGWDIIKETLNVLLEGLPRGLKLNAIRETIRQVAGVHDVHDLHVWTLGTHAHALSCHVLIDDVPPSTSEQILQKINVALDHEFHIHHTTIQFEHVNCAETGNCCSMDPQRASS